MHIISVLHSTLFIFFTCTYRDKTVTVQELGALKLKRAAHSLSVLFTYSWLSYSPLVSSSECQLLRLLVCSETSKVQVALSLRRCVLLVKSALKPLLLSCPFYLKVRVPVKNRCGFIHAILFSVLSISSFSSPRSRLDILCVYICLFPLLFSFSFSSSYFL